MFLVQRFIELFWVVIELLDVPKFMEIVLALFKICFNIINTAYANCQISAILYADRGDRRIKSPGVSPVLAHLSFSRGRQSHACLSFLRVEIWSYELCIILQWLMRSHSLVWLKYFWITSTVFPLFELISKTRPLKSWRHGVKC